jgi:methylmalonyl-CoA epimerase
VVQKLAGAYTFWRDTLGLPLIREAEVKDQGVRAALLACGACEIELIEPTVPDTGVARFLAQRGEGLHHLCLESDNVGRDVQRFVGTGVEMIDAKPRKGLAGMIAFVHPRSCAGILVELATPGETPPSTEGLLTMTVVHLIVEDVQRTTHLYRDLFGLPIRISHPDWSIAQLAVGGVALQLSSTTATSGKPGISILRLMTRDIPDIAARLAARGLSFRQDAVGLVLGPAATHGVPMIIHQPIG